MSFGPDDSWITAWLIGDTSSKPSRVFVYDDNVYCGKNGGINQLRENGKDEHGETKYIRAENTLEGLGTSNISFAGDNGHCLYVGINGYVVKIDPKNFTSRVWTYSLPGSGYHNTNVVFEPKTGRVVAACNGYLYLLSLEGHQLAKNSLKGMGNGEVRLALNGDRLYVASRGYVAAISVGIDDFHRLAWGPVSLPECGFGVTNVVFIGHPLPTLCVGCGGYVYLVDPANGELKRRYDLKGWGQKEVRLAGVGQKLFIGSNGRVAAIDLVNFKMPWEGVIGGGSVQTEVYLAPSGVLYAFVEGKWYRISSADSDDPHAGRIRVGSAVAEFGVDANPNDIIDHELFAASYDMLYRIFPEKTPWEPFELKK